MGNYAASGGYYIATNSKRVFAQPTTLTGSIGVFLVKFDASEWAQTYGIRSDYHPHGSQGAAHLPLTPLTQGMKDNLERLSLGFYDYFKSIVASGRFLTVEEVEKIAQGRVWTGEQAKEVGLVGETLFCNCLASIEQYGRAIIILTSFCIFVSKMHSEVSIGR
jgi:protease-4